MLRNDEFYVQKMIKENGGIKEMDATIELVKSWLNKCYYKSKDIRLDEWNPPDEEIYEIVLATFTAVLRFGKSGTTYQSMMGIMSGRYPHRELLDRVKTAAEIIALCVKTDLIDMWRTGSGAYYMLTSKYTLDSEIPEPDDFRIHLAPIPEFNANKPAGFGSLLLGGRHNHHERDICIDHINRMNAIPLQLNRELLRMYTERPTKELKTEEQKRQWKNFIHTSYKAYIQTVKAGNEFYLEHNYDKRGRTYARGYHISTQGSAFKKAAIQLKNTELVEMRRTTR